MTFEARNVFSFFHFVECIFKWRFQNLKIRRRRVWIIEFEFLDRSWNHRRKFSFSFCTRMYARDFLYLPNWWHWFVSRRQFFRRKGTSWKIKAKRRLSSWLWWCLYGEVFFFFHADRSCRNQVAWSLSRRDQVKIHRPLFLSRIEIPIIRYSLRISPIGMHLKCMHWNTRRRGPLCYRGSLSAKA